MNINHNDHNKNPFPDDRIEQDETFDPLNGYDPMAEISVLEDIVIEEAENELEIEGNWNGESLVPDSPEGLEQKEPSAPPAAYFRGSLDVDKERAYKGITSIKDRTFFDASADTTLERVNITSDEQGKDRQRNTTDDDSSKEGFEKECDDGLELVTSSELEEEDTAEKDKEKKINKKNIPRNTREILQHKEYLDDNLPDLESTNPAGIYYQDLVNAQSGHSKSKAKNHSCEDRIISESTMITVEETPDDICKSDQLWEMTNVSDGKHFSPHPAMQKTKCKKQDELPVFNTQLSPTGSSYDEGYSSWEHGLTNLIHEVIPPQEDDQMEPDNTASKESAVLLSSQDPSGEFKTESCYQQFRINDEAEWMEFLYYDIYADSSHELELLDINNVLWPMPAPENKEYDKPINSSGDKDSVKEEKFGAADIIGLDQNKMGSKTRSSEKGSNLELENWKTSYVMPEEASEQLPVTEALRFTLYKEATDKNIVLKDIKPIVGKRNESRKGNNRVKSDSTTRTENHFHRSRRSAVPSGKYTDRGNTNSTVGKHRRAFTQGTGEDGYREHAHSAGGTGGPGGPKDPNGFDSTDDDTNDGNSGNSGGHAYHSNRDFQYDETEMFFSTYSPKDSGKVGRTALRNIRRVTRYGTMYALSSIQGNAAAEGMILTGRTAGTYLLVPAMQQSVKSASRITALVLLYRMNVSQYEFMRDPHKIGKVILPYVKKMYGCQISYFAEKARLRPLKAARNMGYKLNFSVKMQIKRSANKDNMHALSGVFLAERFAKIGIKAFFRSLRTSVKAAKYFIPQMKRIRKKMSSPTVRIKSNVNNSCSADTTNSTKLKSKRISRTKKALSNAGMSGKASSTVDGIGIHKNSEYMLRNSAKAATRKVAKVSAKESAKATRKAALLLVKAASTIIHLVFNLLGMLLMILGPIGIIALLATITLVSFLNTFKTDSDYYYDNVESKTAQEKEADDEISIQQYTDILVDCHEAYKEKIQKLYEDGSYESVNITYQDKKNDGVTKIYEESARESNSIETGNNIREIMTMAAALFNFDYEKYATDKDKWGWVSEYVNMNSKKDRVRLEKFLRNNGMDPYNFRDTTYQKLIRAYLVGLFNGSHTTKKKVEITYCGGCVLTGIDDEGIPTYTCPGHRHLYVTITTYYFDDIFGCELKAKSDLDEYSPVIPSVSVTGSSTIEKLWNGMIGAGYSEEATAGAIGNLMWESGGGPSDVLLNAVESNGEGIGMVQWSYERKRKFLDFLASRGIAWPNEDVVCQLEYMLYELNNGEWSWAGTDYGYSASTNTSLSGFKTCRDVPMATQYFCANYERCYYIDAHMETRISYAQGVYNAYHGKTPVRSG